jgi:hypothetical protein
MIRTQSAELGSLFHVQSMPGMSRLGPLGLFAEPVGQAFIDPRKSNLPRSRMSILRNARIAGEWPVNGIVPLCRLSQLAFRSRSLTIPCAWLMPGRVTYLSKAVEQRG